MTLQSLQAILLTGLVLGSLYALISTGLSMVWGTLRIFNFAYGSLMTIGAYVAWTIADKNGLGVGIGVGIAVAAAVLIGLGTLLERILIEPFIKRPDVGLIAIITTLAGSLFLENGAHILWGPRLKQLPSLFQGNIKFLGTVISLQDLIIMISAPLILALVALFLARTRLGRAIRAVEQNRDSALLAGVNVPLIYALTFGLSTGLAALAGIMLGITRFITPSMGDAPLLSAFLVVILGGLGSLGGTMAAAYIIALIEATAMTFLGLYWTPVVLFAIMILTLVFKPNGLFGKE
jgi:branched-chain amino acid transport system permease protein